jgi:two-component system OmpR family sensor kinase
MKLVVRATVWIFLFLTISSSAIGYFAISKYQSSQINIIGDSLNGKIKALTSTSEDPLTVSQYLAQISDIPLTVEYISDTGTVTVLSVSGPNIPNLPPSALLNQARHDDVNYGPQLRIRTFQMANQKKLLFAESLSTIKAEVKTLTRELILFIIVIDLIAALAAFFVFKRDGKINQVSHLMAQQQVVMQKFLGDASHELRTPLTVIKGYVDLARNSSNLKKIEGYLDKSAQEIFRMESLIQDLLFLAEVGEAQSDRRESVDLGKILKEYLEVLEALSPERTVSIKLSGNSTILADPRLMDRMIGNIFSNIRRHTPVDASVNVSVAESGKELIIMIEDGGQGLSEYPDKPRQIKRFTSQRSPEGGGTGLGMSIIAGIIERYGGTLMLSQSSLGGLNVKITLPLP